MTVIKTVILHLRRRPHPKRLASYYLINLSSTVVSCWCCGLYLRPFDPPELFFPINYLRLRKMKGKGWFVIAISLMPRHSPHKYGEEHILLLGAEWTQVFPWRKVKDTVSHLNHMLTFSSDKMMDILQNFLSVLLKLNSVIDRKFLFHTSLKEMFRD